MIGFGAAVHRLIACAMIRPSSRAAFSPSSPSGLTRTAGDTHQPKRPGAACPSLHQQPPSRSRANRRRARKSPRRRAAPAAPAAPGPEVRPPPTRPCPHAARLARRSFAPCEHSLGASTCGWPAAPTWPRRSRETRSGAGPRRWEVALGPPRTGAPVPEVTAALWQAQAYFVTKPVLSFGFTRPISSRPSYEF